MRPSRKYLLAALTPPVLVLLAVLIYPTVYVIRLAFQHQQLGSGTPSSWAGFANFSRLFKDTRFWWALSHSLEFSAISLLVALPVGCLLAALMARQMRGTGILRVLLILPMTMTPLVVGALFRFIFQSDGLAEYLFAKVGIHNVVLLGSTHLALPTVAVVDAWQWVPFIALAALAGLESLPKEVSEAAQLDGVGPLREFFSIALPQIRPILTIVLLVRFMDSFREFDKIYIMTNGGPGTSSETLPIYLWRYAFSYFDVGYAAAIGIVMLIIVTVISSVLVRRFRATQGAST